MNVTRRRLVQKLTYSDAFLQHAKIDELVKTEGARFELRSTALYEEPTGVYEEVEIRIRVKRRPL